MNGEANGGTEEVDKRKIDEKTENGITFKGNGLAARAADNVSAAPHGKAFPTSTTHDDDIEFVARIYGTIHRYLSVSDCH